MSGIFSRRRAWSERDVPVNEKLRSKVIEEYAFDTPQKDNLSCFVQSLANSLATITRCQIVCLSIVKDDKQFFYARRGLDAPETSRSVSFCAHAINKPQEPLIVLNALKDSRFAANPLVLGDPNIKFYYGVPLVNMEGVALGALCSINDKPSQLRPEQEAAFNLMAKMCVCQLELVRIFRLAKFDDEGNRNKRAKTIKHIRTTIGSNISLLPSSNSVLRIHMESSGSIYDDFETLLCDELGCMLVFFQLGKEQNLELLMFWQLAEAYRNNPCIEFLVGAVDAFLVTNSQYEVNLDHRYKKQVLDVYDRMISILKQNVGTEATRNEAQRLCTPELLDKLQLRIFVLLYENTYKRLKDSPAYEEYLSPCQNRSASFLRSIAMLSPWSKKLSTPKSEVSSARTSEPSLSRELTVRSNSELGNTRPELKLAPIGRGRSNTTEGCDSDKRRDSFLEKLKRRKGSGNKSSMASTAELTSKGDESPMLVSEQKEENVIVSCSKTVACSSPIPSLRFVGKGSEGDRSPMKYSLTNCLDSDGGAVVVHSSTDTLDEDANCNMNTAGEDPALAGEHFASKLSTRTAVS